MTIPVIANGEIWDYQSAQACMQATGCDAVMLGRGALNIPNLSRVVKYNEPRMPWPQVVQLLQKYVHLEKAGRYRFIPRLPVSNSGSATCAKSIRKPLSCLPRSAR
ncbi:tRNA-dihydrouridine synthase C [Serratia fonticola]|uniref:tRNA-dihydrouridine synthase C n=1 Tax=Serratia fonticola TaxID=47917 RepID=A0A4V6KTV6_SERFO|nr:tRNA-dihydrouridine synthase C [Serratia fonticola]